jgi:hypothetical protein
LYALTGLKRPEFADLLVAFEAAYRRQEQVRWDSTVRHRQPGGGRKGALPTAAEKLLFILFYVRHYPVQRVQAVLFGMVQGQSWEWIHRLLPILEQALGQKVALPERPGTTWEALLAQCPELECLVDATERPRNRPKDGEEQQRYYSGKKKRHTVKNTLVTNKQGRRVIYLGRTAEGKRHDKSLVEEDAPPFPEGSRIEVDSGYQGWQVEGAEVTGPCKKPRKKELSAEQKEANCELSQRRVRVEHAIAGIKVHSLVHDVYQGRSEGFADRAMVVATGLYNFKSRQRDLVYQMSAVV